MRIEWFPSIEDLPRERYNALVAPGNPSMRWEWLRVLERNALRTGQAWKGQHALVYDGDELVAAAPFWWRGDSWGDFVFDQEFAAVARSMKLPYYPKLVGTVPFTAAMGYRFLHEDSPRGRQAAALILDGALKLAQDRGTSLNLLWLHPDWIESEETQNLLQRHRGVLWPQPHFWWERRGWTDYEAFLGSLDKNRRRNARREIQSAAEHGLRVVISRAAACPASWHRTMAELYHRTNDQFGWMAARFLDEEFFEEAGREAGDLVWYVAAVAEGQETPVAMSFLLSDGTHWIGRYWGEVNFYKNLHFQLCYHEPLRFILNGTGQSFDPGMGSPHKIQRGFQPRPALSWHWHAQRPMAEVFRRIFL